MNEQLSQEPKSRWKNEDIFAQGQWIKGYIHENYSFATHTHDFCELNIVLSGEGTHCLGMGKYEITAGDVFVIPPGVSHSYSAAQQLDIYHLLIHSDFFQRYTAELGVLPGYTMLFTVEPQLRMEPRFAEQTPRRFLRLDQKRLDELMPVLMLISGLYYDERPEKNIMANALALYAVVFLCQRYREQYLNDQQSRSVYFNAVAECLEDIDVHLSEEIRVEELARKNGMSRSTFLRAFKCLTGQTPAKYILRRRMAQAKLLLLQSEKKISEIAADCGFYDSAHFIRLFEWEEGRTPSEFRKRV